MAEPKKSQSIMQEYLWDSSPTYSDRKLPLNHLLNHHGLSF